MNLPENNTFTYIIGNNGSGKSRALEGNADQKMLQHDVVVISSGISDKFTFRPRIKKTVNGSYRYMGNRTVGNGTHIGTIAANAIHLYMEVIERKHSADFKDFLRKIGFDGKVGIAYRKIRRSAVPHFETVEFTENVIKEKKSILESDVKPFEAAFYKSDNAFKFSDLSSGEQYIISTALKILASSKEGVIYYIDEPELSLHVEWQVKWADNFQPLLTISPHTKSFIATHSPVIISSALKKNAACYLLRSDEFHSIKTDETDVEGILFKDFNTLTPNNKHVYEEIASILNRTITDLNSNSEKTEESALESVKELGVKIEGLSTTGAEREVVNQIFDEFSIGVKDLLLMSKLKTEEKKQ